MNLRDQVKRGTQRSRSLLVLRDERLGPLTTSSTATSDLMAVVNAPFPSGALVPERGEELFLEAARAAPQQLLDRRHPLRVVHARDDRQARRVERSHRVQALY